ncbi:MAG: phosphoadenosine phosphosulfate reductase family protein [Candidatus Cloacimonetes bacterium]|nr:phosphoadenosine phosphosulfate reductase family protein [Candidatus Cloacimonadota bacterium]
MWCKGCYRETAEEKCDFCENETLKAIPLVIYWCTSCNVPIIKKINNTHHEICTLCGNEIEYLCSDLRPVFPEERLLFEILNNEPFKFLKQNIWASDNRYYIDGKPTSLKSSFYKKLSLEIVRDQLACFSADNKYEVFNQNIAKFIKANKSHLIEITNEAFDFIEETAATYSKEKVVISFSGGKDSTITADLVVRTLADPSLVHIFGDTTLEFPLTLDYVANYRKNNPKAIFKIAKNEEQDFFKVCSDIGPPARMLRWCCSMFKTGPIARVLNKLYDNEDILTFYGIRSCESVSRSRYNRVEDSAESVKIQKQKVASPIFLWKDIDVWLYIFSEGLDFNNAYRLGYDRVGCWCCPNNSLRAEFLTKIYLPTQYDKWQNFLVKFARQIGKIDAEEYITSGAWKARQGGKGLTVAEDIKVKYTNCTTEEYAKVYLLNKPINDNLIKLFMPFGKIAPELGRKLINETIIFDIATNVPILSIQPFIQDGNYNSVKIKTMNVAKHEDLQRMVGYQIKKFNACRKCLKCESLCKYRAISIVNGEYFINSKRCRHCKMCVTAKYLRGGCMMDKYLRTKIEPLRQLV